MDIAKCATCEEDVLVGSDAGCWVLPGGAVVHSWCLDDAAEEAYWVAEELGIEDARDGGRL